MRYLLMLIILCYTICASSQDKEPQAVTVKTHGKDTFTGILTKITADSIYIDSEGGGILSFSRSKVKYFTRGIHDLSQKNNSDPYLIPTAFTSGAGRHFYRNYFFLGQHFNFGINEYTDFSVGMELFSPIFFNELWPVTQLGVKIAAPVSEKFRIGLSSKTFFNNDGGILLISAPLTLGSERNNFSFSPTYGYGYGGDGSVIIPAFNFNISLSDRVRITTDLLFADGTILGTSLLEIKLKRGALLQPGLFITPAGIGIPNFSFMIPFGRK